MKLTPTKVERLFKRMRAICEKSHGPNPYHGELYFYDGAVYAVNACCIVRFEGPFVCDGSHGKWDLHVVDGILCGTHAVELKTRYNLVAEKDNAADRAHRIADLMAMGEKCDTNREVHPKLLAPAFECFKALDVPVRFSQDLSKLRLNWQEYAKYGEGAKRYMALDAIVMNIRR